MFFDEINLAPPSLQATTYQILLDKQVGEQPLHPKTIIFGAGNLTEDRAGVYEMPKPIRTRAGVYELRTPNAEEFTEYGSKKGLNTWVLTFINRFQHRLFSEEESSDDVITPRGWEFVSEIMGNNTDYEDVKLLTGGILGEGVSSEFASFIKLKDEIPTPKQLLSGKKQIPEKIDLKYACVSSLVEYFGQQTSEEQEKIIGQISDLDEDLGAEHYVLTLRLCKQKNPEIIKTLMNSDKEEKVTKYAKYLL